jgi:hypothetical protein
MEGKMTEEWRINRIGYATPYETHIFIEDAHGSPICGVWCPPGNKEQEANTLLLAAAPKMAKALQMLLSKSIVELEQGDPWVAVMAALNAAGVEVP